MKYFVILQDFTFKIPMVLTTLNNVSELLPLTREYHKGDKVPMFELESMIKQGLGEYAYL